MTTPKKGSENEPATDLKAMAEEVLEKHRPCRLTTHYGACHGCGCGGTAFPCDAYRLASAALGVVGEMERLNGESLAQLRVLDLKAEEARQEWKRAESAQAREKALRDLLAECLIDQPHQNRAAAAPKCLCRWCKARAALAHTGEPKP